MSLPTNAHLRPTARRDDMQAAGIAPTGVVGRNPDLTAVAGACGAAAVRIHDANALQRELRQALSRASPALIEAIAADFQPL